MNPIAMIAGVMIQALIFFSALCGNNYTIGIILLTLTVTIALYPLTLQSSVQMAAMQKVQPKIKHLQEKHKEDPQTMQKEIMALYKNEKINPVGGCLPMLLKIPFFIALFFALQSQEFKNLVLASGAANQFVLIKNQFFPNYIFAALIGATTYMTQRLMPGADNPTTKTMNQIMPIFMVFISAPFLAGVQIYWVVSNGITATQQYFINKKL